MPVEPLLSGGVGTVPLAPISAVTKADLPTVLDRVGKRYNELASPAREDFRAATYLLMGLRYPEPLIRQLLKSVTNMKESSTYQAILAEGEREGSLREAKKLLLLLGQRRLGEPPAQVKAAIEGMTNLERVEALLPRVDEVKTWDELLASEGAGEEGQP